MYSIPLLLSERKIILRKKTNPITSEKKVYDKVIKALYLDSTLKQDANGCTDIQLAGYTLGYRTAIRVVEFSNGGYKIRKVFA